MTHWGFVRRIGVCGSWLAAFTLFACSSSDSNGTNGGSCSAVTGCGGDLVGTWKIQSVCDTVTSDTTDTSFCPSASVSATGLTGTGMITFNSDSSYTATLTLGGTLTYGLPNSCLTMGGQTITCAQLSAALAENPDEGTITFLSCQPSGGNCDCNFSLMPQTSSDSGTYSTSGTSVILASAQGGSTTETYCATSTDLKMSSLGMTMDTGMMGTASVTGNIYASKE